MLIVVYELLYSQVLNKIKIAVRVLSRKGRIYDESMNLYD